MRSLRPSAVVAVLAVALPLAGCYGSTEPATNIGIDRATLNANGTANAGQAHVYFEYWPAAHPETVTPTIGTDVPGGTSGNYAEPTANSFAGLAVATQYSYRVCARDQSAPNGACSQTRTFSTSRPSGDVVRGNYVTIFGGINHSASIDAHSTASGGSPGGTMTLPGDKGPVAFSGNVTCVRVQGNKATVGAVGSDATGPAKALFVVVDGAPGPWTTSGDQIDWTVTPGAATPPNCATGSFATLRSLYYSELVVFDAP